MSDQPFNLAIETSGRIGSVTLGRDDELLATCQMPPQERHRVDLMPTIDQLCRAHAVGPRQIRELYLSIGPGSFTGLRIGVTTAKMFAQAVGTRIVAVPSVEVVAHNVSRPESRVPREEGDVSRLRSRVSHGDARDSHSERETRDPRRGTVAVCLNMKKDTLYTGLFDGHDGQWRLMGEPGLMTVAQLLERAPRPVAIVGDPLPAVLEGLRSSEDFLKPQVSSLKPASEESKASGPEGHGLDRVTVLPTEMALARSEAVWALGRRRAVRGEFVDALSLIPLYAREPEAKELWDRRHF